MGFDFFREEDGQLEQNLAPVLDTAGPFPQDILGSQVEHFKQSIIRWEDAFPFSNFA